MIIYVYGLCVIEKVWTSANKQTHWCQLRQHITLHVIQHTLLDLCPF